MDRLIRIHWMSLGLDSCFDVDVFVQIRQICPLLYSSRSSSQDAVSFCCFFSWRMEGTKGEKWLTRSFRGRKMYISQNLGDWTERLKGGEQKVLLCKGAVCKKWPARRVNELKTKRRWGICRKDTAVSARLGPQGALPAMAREANGQGYAHTRKHAHLGQAFVSKAG